MSGQEKRLSASFVTMFYMDKQHHQRHSHLLHTHKNLLELLYIMSGDGQYMVDEKVYIVHHGDLVVCNANVKHGELLNWENRMESYCGVYTNLRVPNLPDNCLTAWDVPPVYHFSGEERATLEHMIWALFSLSQKRPGANTVCQCLSEALLNLAFGRVKQPLAEPSMIPLERKAFIQNIVQFLDEHYTENPTLEKLGKQFYSSPSFISHVFKSEMGVPPMKYVIHRKIGEAQNLLMWGDDLISDIAFRLGFSDSSHFNKIFKKYVGLSPHEFREYAKSQKSGCLQKM